MAARRMGARETFMKRARDIVEKEVILICGSNSILQKQIFPECFPQDTVHLGMMKIF
jgi:hypothetical protein